MAQETHHLRAHRAPRSALERALIPVLAELRGLESIIEVYRLTGTSADHYFPLEQRASGLRMAVRRMWGEANVERERADVPSLEQAWRVDCP